MHEDITGVIKQDCEAILRCIKQAYVERKGKNFDDNLSLCEDNVQSCKKSSKGKRKKTKKVALFFPLSCEKS